MFTMKCPKCNQINDADNIDGSTGMNEEGEDYFDYDFTCGSCSYEIHKGGGWGEFDLDEAIADILDCFSEDDSTPEIKPSKKSPSLIGDSITVTCGTNDRGINYTDKFLTRVRAVFKPAKEYEDTLKEEYKQFIGKEFVFQYTGIQEEDEMFPGIWTLMPLPNKEEFVVSWVPEFDLEIIEYL